MINAFYKAGQTLGIAGWTLLSNASLTDLVNAREALYMGPLLEEMPGLSEEQKKALANALGLAWPGELPEDPPVEPEPEPQPQPDPDPDPGNATPYLGLTNQEMINFFYKVADETGAQGWNLIVKAGLEHLVDDRQGEYTGPVVEKMGGLTTQQRGLLREYLASEQENASGEAPYPGLVNQDMINIFYRAAAQFGENGWNWITGEGLGYIAATQQMRYQSYMGPAIEDLSTLGEDQRQAMLAALAEFD
jgi:hypothetical protein